MRKSILILCAVLVMSCVSIAQEAQIPGVNIKTLEGKIFSTDEITNEGNPMIISFWATWCKPCIKELNAISEIYEDMQDETGVKLIAVSIDDSRTSPKVAPFVNGRGWDYDVYLDVNHDFKRAMNVNLVPHTFLIGGDRTVVRQHTSYAPGDEEKLFDYVRKVAAGEALE